MLLFLFLLAGAIGGFIIGYTFRGLFPPRKRPSLDGKSGIESKGFESKRKSEILSIPARKCIHHFQEFCSRGSANGSALLAGCDIRVRLILAMTAILATVISKSIGFGLIMLVCSLAGLAAMRTPPKIIVHRLLGPLALAALVLLMRTFMTGTTPMATIDLGFCRLTATQEGCWGGALIACRILGSFGIAMILCQGRPLRRSSPPCDGFRVPRTWIEIAVLMYRYLHIFLEQATCVVSAQKVRLGYSNLRRSFQSLGSLAGMVVLRSLDQAEKSHEAMRPEGIGATCPFPPCQPALAPSGSRLRRGGRDCHGMPPGGKVAFVKRIVGPAAIEARDVSFAYPDRIQASWTFPSARWRESSWPSWVPTVRARPLC